MKNNFQKCSVVSFFSSLVEWQWFKPSSRGGVGRVVGACDCRTLSWAKLGITQHLVLFHRNGHMYKSHQTASRPTPCCRLTKKNMAHTLWQQIKPLYIHIYVNSPWIPLPTNYISISSVAYQSSSRAKWEKRDKIGKKKASVCSALPHKNAWSNFLDNPVRPEARLKTKRKTWSQQYGKQQWAKSLNMQRLRNLRAKQTHG